jgi:hypothetical protein
MSIPTLCQACYKHYRSTVVKACPFCADVQCPEAMLCDLVREGQSEKHPFRCAAFRPALSVVHYDETDVSIVRQKFIGLRQGRPWAFPVHISIWSKGS